MELRGSTLISASQARVWDALNDPQVLKDCIPGCESMTQTEDNTYDAVAMAKLGPVKAKFSGRIILSDIDPPNSYRISGEGSGGSAGFAKGGAQVQLSPEGENTLLSYNVDATVGGKIAQVGQRLIDSAAKKMADDFFENFNRRVSTDQTSQSKELIQGREHNLRGWTLFLGIAAVIAAMLFFFVGT